MLLLGNIYIGVAMTFDLDLQYLSSSDHGLLPCQVWSWCIGRLGCYCTYNVYSTLGNINVVVTSDLWWPWPSLGIILGQWSITLIRVKKTCWTVVLLLCLYTIGEQTPYTFVHCRYVQYICSWTDVLDYPMPHCCSGIINTKQTVLAWLIRIMKWVQKM